MILLKENSGHVHHNQGYQPQPGAPPRQRNNTQNTFEAVTAYRFVGGMGLINLVHLLYTGYIYLTTTM